MTAGPSPERKWTMPVSACRICDKDRNPLEIPDEPCGHSDEQRHTVSVEVVPLSELVEAREQRDHAQEQKDIASSETVSWVAQTEWERTRRHEVEAERDEAREQLERLREALRPFCRAPWPVLTDADLVRARSALDLHEPSTEAGSASG